MYRAFLVFLALTTTRSSPQLNSPHHRRTPDCQRALPHILERQATRAALTGCNSYRWSDDGARHRP